MECDDRRSAWSDRGDGGRRAVPSPAVLPTDLSWPVAISAGSRSFRALPC